MLPELKPDQKVFVEITNLEHGGDGWELGTCLWSPTRDTNNQRTWKIMDKINPGDRIIHLVDIENQYHWFGVSTVNGMLKQDENGPPKPRNWLNYPSYQRIELSEFQKLQKPLGVNSIFKEYHAELTRIRKSLTAGQFYVLYKNTNEIRMAQRYIAPCPELVYEFFNSLSDKIKFSYLWSDSFDVPKHPDYNTPEEIESTVTRRVRDTKMIKKLKEINNWKCQICGIRIQLPSGKFYAEGHHIRPLGNGHNGPDVEENIIILCPNHHAEFDYGSIAINPETKAIERVVTSGEHDYDKLAYSRKNLEKSFLRYHYDEIFNK